MRLGKTTLIHFTSQVVVSIAGFLTTFFIARLLGAETLGTYAVVVALLFWLNIPVAAIHRALNKRISEGVDRGAYLSGGFLLSVLLGGTIALLVILLSELVAAYVGAAVSEFLAVLVLSNALLVSVYGALDGQKKVGQKGVLKAVERLVRASLQIALIVLGYGLVGLLAGHAAALLVGVVIGITLFEIRPELPSWAHVTYLLEYARYAWLGTLKTRAFGWMDTIVLAFFVSSALIGIYEVAWTLASFLALVSTSVQQTLFPEFSELGVDDEYDRIHHYLNEGLVFTGIFAIPGLFGAMILGPRLLKIYRPEFAAGATILVVLIVARLLAAFGSQFLSAINAVDRPDIAFRINLVFVVANATLNVTLIYTYGWYGAAVATTVSALIMLGLAYMALAKLIGPPDVPFIEILSEVGAAIAMAAGVLAAESFVPESHYGTVALVMIGAGVYGLVLLGISTRVRQKARALLPLPSGV